MFGGTGGSVKGIFKIEPWVKPGTYHGEYRYKVDRGPGQLKIADIDRDLGNNTAGLTITVTAAGKPQPGPSTSASTTPSASAFASSAPGAGNAPGPNGGSGGNLANTGSTALVAGGRAAAAVTLGGVLYAMARRRRSA
ncbi:hypothetical protein ACFQ77_41245 [Streptomyces virginiae]|uniref:hypothetical protein n=1 Tax=Streptomyces virginiae TaxID=1961 RepID=UPI0036CA9A0D